MTKTAIIQLPLLTAATAMPLLLLLLQVSAAAPPADAAAAVEASATEPHQWTTEGGGSRERTQQRPRPQQFQDPESFKLYLRGLNDYFATASRPRYGKRSFYYDPVEQLD